MLRKRPVGLFLLLGLGLALGWGSGCGTSQGGDGDPTLPHFLITHAGTGTAGDWLEITIQVKNSLEQDWPDWVGTIVVSTDSAAKDQISWRNKTGLGAFTTGGAAADQAGYTFMGDDRGLVKFEIKSGTAQTIKIFVSFAGAVKGTSADLVVSEPTPPPVAPQWFPWWLGDEATTCNANNCDEYAPRNANSAGWVGVYPVEHTTQDNPAELLHTGNNKGLNDRVSQGFTKISMEAERTLSRNEIRTLIDWCRAHPGVTVFLWIMDYNWLAPYEVYEYREWAQAFPTPDGINKRVYFYWEEFADCPDNLVLVLEFYWCQPDVLGGDFSDKTVMAQREIQWLEDNYWRFVTRFDLVHHAVGAVGLGGPEWHCTNFNSVDLAREMDLVKSRFPLGIGFFSGAREWAFSGAVPQADQFCRDWLDESSAAGGTY